MGGRKKEDIKDIKDIKELEDIKEYKPRIIDKIANICIIIYGVYAIAIGVSHIISPREINPTMYIIISISLGVTIVVLMLYRYVVGRYIQILNDYRETVNKYIEILNQNKR